MNKTAGNKAPIDPANPPVEALGIAFSILAYGFSAMPKIFDGLESVATVEVISSPLFPGSMSRATLAYIRLSLAVFFSLTTLYRYRKKGHVVVIPYKKESRLVKRPIHLDGIRSQIMFTQWCWNCLTLCFFLNGFITLYAAHSVPTFLNHPTILKSCILLFEIAAPTSMLVSTITKYALWPQAMKGPAGSQNLRKPVAIIQHNLNIIATLLEVGVLGRIPVRLSDIPITLVYGCVYVLFMWSIRGKLVETGEPQFIYFFFDTTLGKKWSISVIFGLLTILILFYVLFTGIDDVLMWLGGGFWVNCIMIGGFSSLFCRFKD